MTIEDINLMHPSSIYFPYREAFRKILSCKIDEGQDEKTKYIMQAWRDKANKYISKYNNGNIAE